MLLHSTQNRENILHLFKTEFIALLVDYTNFFHLYILFKITLVILVTNKYPMILRPLCPNIQTHPASLSLVRMPLLFIAWDKQNHQLKVFADCTSLSSALLNVMVLIYRKQPEISIIFILVIQCNK